jgi:hypothetical protein
VETVTRPVDTENVTDIAPGGTVTLAGTVATAESLVKSATTVPPAGAVWFRVTVPVDAAPPGTVVGLRLNDETGAGVSVSTAYVLKPP